MHGRSETATAAVMHGGRECTTWEENQNAWSKRASRESISHNKNGYVCNIESKSSNTTANFETTVHPTSNIQVPHASLRPIPYHSFPSPTPSSQPSRRKPVTFPDPLINHIPKLRLRIAPIEHHTLPPFPNPIMQIKAQIPCSLIPRRIRARLRCLASQHFGAGWQSDGRVRVAWVGIRERPPTSAGVESVV